MSIDQGTKNGAFGKTVPLSRQNEGVFDENGENDDFAF